MAYRRSQYEHELRAILAGASPKALAICRRWEGEHFGKPGWGGVDFVRATLTRAEAAIDALREVSDGE